MLYPFSLTLDLYIQAESFEEAKKLAEAYVQDASLDTTDYPEIVQDVLEVAELYKVRVDDESESLIESLEDLQDTFKQGHHVCIEVGKLPYSIDLNYLRNLQELSVEAVEYLTGPKEYSREQAFNIIQEWNKEFTEKYGNYDFDGSYYDEIDEFIDKKLGTI